MPQFTSPEGVTDQVGPPPVVDADPLDGYQDPSLDGKKPLFTLGDKTYYMPNEVPPNIAFKFLRDRRRQDIVYATAGVIENVIGADALDALAEADDMKPEDMRALMKIIQEKVMGQMQDVMGLGN